MKRCRQQLPFRLSQSSADTLSVRNRPAERLRRDVVRSWKRTAARNWPIFPFIAAVTALYAGFLALEPTTSWWRGFCTGAFVGVVVVAIVWLIHLFSGSQSALFGTLGEQATAEILESRRMKRAGWRVVNGLAFAGHGDVDHTLIGPSGVFAVESKWTNLPWQVGQGARCDSIERALVQARLGAKKIKSSLRAHHIARECEIRPVVIIWGPGAPDIAGGFIEIDGVVVAEGAKLRTWTNSLGGRVLDASDVADAFSALLAELENRVPDPTWPELAAARR